MTIITEKLNGQFFQNSTDAFIGQVSKVVEYGYFLNSKGGDTQDPLRGCILRIPFMSDRRGSILT